MKAVQGIFTTLTGIGDSVGIVVLHRPPTYSPLAKVLQNYTRIPIREPDDSPSDCPPGSVTVAPAGYHLLVGRRRRLSSDPHSPVAPYVDEPGLRAHLSLDAPVAYSRPSIDVTFRSVAESTDSVVAVLLSCANDDGAAGCAAVQAAGGRVVIQDPRTCEAAVAVNAALRRIDPDHVAGPRGIGEWLAAAVAG